MTDVNVIGNRARQLPWHADYLPSEAPAKLRIYRIDTDDKDLAETPWQMDECGVLDGRFAVSEWCVNYSTFEQALEEARAILREEVRQP